MIPKFIVISTDRKSSYALLYNEEITPNYIFCSILVISKVFNVLHGLAHYFCRQRFEVHGYLIIRYSVKNNILSKSRKMFLAKTSFSKLAYYGTCKHKAGLNSGQIWSRQGQLPLYRLSLKITKFSLV